MRLAGGRRSKERYGTLPTRPVWYADYYADGIPVQESTGTASKREAEKILALRVSEVQSGVFVKPANITLTEFGEKYIELCESPQAFMEAR